MNVEEVLSAAAGGSEELSQLLDGRAGELTPELAASVEEAAREAFAKGDGDRMALSRFAASQMYLQIGDRPKGLKNFIEFNDLLYAADDSTDIYLSVRSSMLDAVGMASEIDAANLAFRASVLAAEAGFHARDGAEDRDEWRISVLADISSACKAAPAAGEELWYQRLVYILAVATSEAMGVVEIDGSEKLSQLLRELAKWVEERVPADFEYEPDPKASAEIAAQLATLGESFG